jgi:7-cyano-7-deazaguanine synthase
MDSSPNEALVLLSGGIDSTACVAFLKDRTDSARAIFLDYGQLSRKQEERAACAVASHFGIALTIIRCAGAKPKNAGLISGRNAFLVFLALMETQMRAGIIALGVHSGTRYWDCGPQFVAAVQQLLDGYTDGKIRLSLPFLDWTKREVWDFCKASNVPLELTYSCERGCQQPCGLCDSCRDLDMLYAC